MERRHKPLGDRAIDRAEQVRQEIACSERQEDVGVEQAMRLSPRDPRSFSWLHYASWCHWKLDELREMETASRRSIELYPNYPHSWIALACALGLLDRVRDAREAGRVLRELQPRFRAAHFYDAARVFYGRRFTGEVVGEYRQLRTVLNRATAVK
jgi:hypothetical protein